MQWTSGCEKEKPKERWYAHMWSTVVYIPPLCIQILKQAERDRKQQRGSGKSCCPADKRKNSSSEPRTRLDRDASDADGRFPLVLHCTGRLRTKNGEYRGCAQPEEVRASVQGRGHSSKPTIRERQIQTERHFRHPQAQCNSNGTLGLRGPHLKSGKPIQHTTAPVSARSYIPITPCFWKAHWFSWFPSSYRLPSCVIRQIHSFHTNVPRFHCWSFLFSDGAVSPSRYSFSHWVQNSGEDATKRILTVRGLKMK